MKILELQLDGFTSFRDPTTLDLTDVDLFAITGPTGAGKTSLIDAITFALFGWVGRVGKEVGQLISQNRAALKVMLTFEVSGRTMRVTRRRPRKGASMVVLEQLEGDEWVSAGEGSDRAEPVNRMIRDLLGLDFDGFTRAVVLPQGQFAEFLQGDKGKRRKILSDLLGLARIVELGKTARERAKELKVRGDAKADILTGALAEATPEMLAARQQELVSARERASQIDAISAQLRHLLDQVSRAEERRQHLTELRGRVYSAHENLKSALSAQQELQDSLNSLASQLQARLDQVEAISSRIAEMESRISAHEAEHGSEADLIRMRDAARSLDEARAACQKLEERISEGEAKIRSVRDAVASAESEKRAAEARLSEARIAVEAAELSLEAERRKDHASAACAGLSPGDPCPVCGAELHELPASNADLEAATKALSVARRDLEAAMAADRTASQESAVTTERLTRFENLKQQLSDELTHAGSRLRELEAQLADVSTGEGSHLEALDGLLAWRRDTAAELTKLREEHSAAKVAATEARGLQEQAALKYEAIADRIVAAQDPSAFSELTRLSIDLPGVLDDAGFGQLLSAIDTSTGSLAGDEADLLAAANAAAGSVLGPFPSASHIGPMLQDAARDADRDVAVLEEAIRNLEKRILERQGLQQEVDEIAKAEGNFRWLGRLLEGDEFIAWLQEDALKALCRSGSAHLRRLTGERYRLEILDGDFIVHDVWNGDEARSAKTLSGGETYLASLALALSLADEVARLRIDQSVRLQTLLLDEGFGTLDKHSLDQVVEAIELLAASGRSVGVITHIEELAQRMPTRFEISKSETGSAISIAE